MIDLKKCVDCREEKDIDEFDKRGRGYSSKCRKCLSKPIETQTAPVKTYKSETVRRRRIREIVSRRKSIRYREAHEALRKALRGGWATKPSECEGCGSKARREPWINNVDEPLDCDWLCVPCTQARLLSLWED